MAPKSTESSRKRRYSNLDDVPSSSNAPPNAPPNAPVNAPVNAPPSTSFASSSGPSSSTEQRKKKSGNEDMPGKEYLRKGREIGIRFYEVRKLHSMKRMYMSLGEEGFHKLCDELTEELERRFEESETYANYTDFWLHQEWLEKLVNSLTTNVVAQWMYSTGKKHNDPNLSDTEKEMVAKLTEIQNWSQTFSKKSW